MKILKKHYSFILLFLLFVIIYFTIFPYVMVALRYLVGERLHELIDLFDSDPIFGGLKVVLADNYLKNSWLKASAAIPISLLLIFLIMPKKKEAENANRNVFGSSRWLLKKEFKESFYKWNIKKRPVTGGIVVSYYPRGKTAYVYNEPVGHSIIIGTTRSGKTRRMIIPSIYCISQAGESMVITDPKGELYKKTSLYLRDEQGYNVICVNLRDLKHGDSINLLEDVILEFEKNDISAMTSKANDIAYSLANQREYYGEPIWKNGEESILSALIIYLVMEAPSREEKHLGNVFYMLSALGKEVKGKVPLTKLLESLPIDHPARLAYTSANLAAEKTRGSFFVSVATTLKMWADRSIMNLTAYQSHDIKKLGTEKTALYIIFPDENRSRHGIVSLYLNQIYQSLVNEAEKYENETLPIKVHHLLEEFGALPSQINYATKISVSAGRGILYNHVLQDYGQLKKSYDKSFDIIIANSFTTAYLLTGSYKTAEDISKRAGTKTIGTQSFSASEGNRGNSSSQSATKRDLVMPDELLRWPKEYSLVLKLREYPAKMALPDLSEWPLDEVFSKVNKELGKEHKPAKLWLPKVVSLRSITNELEKTSSKKQKKGRIILNEID